MAIISFGEALIDLLPADNDSSHCVKCAGGAPANVAVGVAKLGQKSVFIGTLSSDAMGRLLTTELQAVGVELAYSPISSHSTALVLVSLDDCGERSFQFYRHNTADLDFTTKSITAYPFTTGDVIGFNGNPTNRCVNQS
jgi:fructokinase